MVDSRQVTVVISGSEVVGEIGKKLASLTKMVVKDIFLRGWVRWTRRWERDGRRLRDRPRMAKKQSFEEVRLQSKIGWDLVEM